MDYTLFGLIAGALVLVGLLIGLVVYVTRKPSTPDDAAKLEAAKKKEIQDCIHTFITKLRGFAKMTTLVDQHSITGEVTDYNHFCNAIDSGISVNCPGLQVSMTIHGLHSNYYEGLRPEPVSYKNGQEIVFINDNGTIRPPDEYKLLNCKGVPRDAVFYFKITHNGIEEDVAFNISIPDFMGKVLK